MKTKNRLQVAMSSMMTMSQTADEESLWKKKVGEKMEETV